MRTFIMLALAGLGAQLVDGSLGMAYGVSSTTLLLFVGVAPALASAAVHIAEVGTTAVSGISHASFGNVDWSKIVWMAVPGGIGAFVGAYLLVYASTAEATAGLVEPLVAAAGVPSPRRPFSLRAGWSRARLSAPSTPASSWSPCAPASVSFSA